MTGDNDMLPTTFSTLLLLAAISAAERINADDALVVNPSVMVSAMDDATLKEIYLGKKTSWEDGSRIVVVVLKDGASHEDLMHRLNKSSSQFLTGWKKLVFTGKGTMPDVVESEDDLVRLIAKTAGAIGFVDKSKITATVKSVTLQ
jgi:ABC-type phosphate transport system substrate-binding protein